MVTWAERECGQEWRAPVSSRGRLTWSRLGDSSHGCAGCVIIDRDLFAIPPEEINDVKVLLFPVGRWIIYAGRGTD